MGTEFQEFHCEAASHDREFLPSPYIIFGREHPNKYTAFTMRIEDEIKQASFKYPYLKANINLLFTGNWLTLLNAKMLKPFGISLQQFNVLRILRGKHPESANIGEITSRMLDKSSNVSRLVDKLVAKNFVSKSNLTHDQRQTQVVITDAGLELLNQASEAVEAGLDAAYLHLTEAQASQLSDLLDLLRG